VREACPELERQDHTSDAEPSVRSNASSGAALARERGVLSPNSDTRAQRHFLDWDRVRWGAAVEAPPEKSGSAVREGQLVRQLIAGLLESERFWERLEKVRKGGASPENVANEYVPDDPEARQAIAHLFKVAADMSPASGEELDRFTRRLEGWLGNLGAVATHAPNKPSLNPDSVRGERVELFIRRSEQRCLSCGAPTRGRDEITRKSRPSKSRDHCGTCEASGEAATWGASQRKAINELLFEVAPVLRGRARDRVGQRHECRPQRARPDIPRPLPPRTFSSVWDAVG